MGCLESKEEKDFSSAAVIPEGPVKTVDERLPFETYRQQFNLKNSWKAITRAMDKTAKDNLLRFFKEHPEHKALHKKLVNLVDDEQLLESTAFENAANDIFNLIDEVMESLEKVDIAIAALKRAGKAHQRIEGFQPEYFKDMEESFIESVKDTLDNRFNEATEKSFRLLFAFCLQHLIDGFNS